MHKIKIGSYVRSMREMPLTLPTLAALTPSYPDLELTLVDGSVEPVPLDAGVDLVGISVITGCAEEAYRIADKFRTRGIPVVLGGVHVTILPGEASRHADAIVTGKGEKSWARLLGDFRNGEMKKVYSEEAGDENAIEEIPVPRWDLHKRWRYMVPYSVQATRGCHHACDFCTVPAVWRRYLKRPVSEVLRDASAAKSRFVAFNDVSLFEDPEYSKELLRGLVPLKKKWGGLATVDIIKDDELLQLLRDSGCTYLLFGFESVSQPTLKQIRKGFNNPSAYQELMRIMHSLNISVQGCFVFGFDHDDKTIFDNTVDRVQELRIDIPRYSIYTPYPGTKLFQRLVSEERITSYNWSDYDTYHVVFRPKKMTEEELYSGFKNAYKKTFKITRILKRMPGFKINTPVNFMGNLTYIILVRRLFKEPRFASPNHGLCSASPPAERDFIVPGERKATCPA